MDSFQNIGQILEFQITRSILRLAKDCLIQLEDQRSYAKKMEDILFEMGVGGFDQSQERYNKARKVVLDDNGEISRELCQLIQKFDFKFKR